MQGPGNSSVGSPESAGRILLLHLWKEMEECVLSLCIPDFSAIKATQMKNSIYFLSISLIAFSSCEKEKKEKPVLNKSNNISLVIGNPLNYGQKNMLLFPVGGNYNPSITEGEKNSGRTETVTVNLTDKKSISFLSRNEASRQMDMSASSEFVNTREEEFDIRNLLFYDQVSRTTYPLVKDTIHILSFAVHNEFKKPLIFFRIVKKDINKDGKFNSKDAVMLYICDTDGKNLTQTTPDNEQFIDYFYYPETKSILVKTCIDIDKDKSFTELDETNFREVLLSNPAFGREIFTKSLKDSLRAIIK